MAQAPAFAEEARQLTKQIWEYFNIERRWMKLAESYRFVEQLQHFLDDINHNYQDK
jgi:hypothetical protein